MLISARTRGAHELCRAHPQGAQQLLNSVAPTPHLIKRGDAVSATLPAVAVARVDMSDCMG